MKEERRTGLRLRLMEHIGGHLWHRYSVMFDQVSLATENLRSDDFSLSTKSRWLSSFLVINKFLSRGSWYLITSYISPLCIMKLITQLYHMTTITDEMFKNISLFWIHCPYYGLIVKIWKRHWKLILLVYVKKSFKIPKG